MPRYGQDSPALFADAASNAEAREFQSHQQRSRSQGGGHADQGPNQINRQARADQHHKRGTRNVHRERGHSKPRNPQRLQQKSAWHDQQQRYKYHLYRPRCVQRYQEGNED